MFKGITRNELKWMNRYEGYSACHYFVLRGYPIPHLPIQEDLGLNGNTPIALVFDQAEWKDFGAKPNGEKS